MLSFSLRSFVGRLVDIALHGQLPWYVGDEYYRSKFGGFELLLAGTTIGGW